MEVVVELVVDEALVAKGRRRSSVRRDEGPRGRHDAYLLGERNQLFQSMLGNMIFDDGGSSKRVLIDGGWFWQLRGGCECLVSSGLGIQAC